MTYYLLCILYLFYTMETFGKKRSWAIFLFEFKILRKAVKTTHNINNTFGQELLMNIQCSGGSRSFAKETRALKMRSVVAGHQKLATTSWEHHQNWSFHSYAKKLPRNSAPTILWSFSIWSKLERWKSSVSGVPCELTENQKKNCFEVLYFLTLCNNEPFLNRIVMCKEKWIL